MQFGEFVCTLHQPCCQDSESSVFMQSAGEERSRGWNSSYKMYLHKMCTNVMVHLFICTCSGNEEVSVSCHKHTTVGDGCAGPGKSVC